MASTPELLEREAELGVLRAAVGGACRGNGTLVVVEGPPGIGKTSLLQAAVAKIDASVLTAVGGPLERAIPYGVVRQLLERSAREDGIPESAGAAACAFGLEGPPGADDGAVLYGLFWLLSDRATDRPFVLVVDDAHWADDPSLRWLTFVARRIHELPVALLVARRPGEPGTDAVLLDGLASLADEIVPVASLSAKSCERMIGQVVGRRRQSGLGALCHEATGGNPFMLREVCAAAQADGADADAVRRVLARGPRELRRAVAVRLQGLPGPAVEVARALSVLGDATASRHVAALAGLKPETVEDAADTLAAADVLRPERPLSFVHPLVRTAIEADMDVGARAAGHAKAAALLFEEGIDLERAAAHLLSTPPAGDPWVVQVLRDAARAAGARGGHDTAAVLLRRAVDEPPARDDTPAVLLELGAAETRVGDPGGRSRLYRAYRSTSDPGIRFGAATQLHRSSIVPANEDEDVLELLDDQLQNVPRGSSGEHAAVAGLIVAARLSALPLPSGARDRADALRSEADALAGDSTEDRFILAALAIDALATNQPAQRVHSLAARAVGDLEAYAGAAHAGYPLHPALVALTYSGRASDALERHAVAIEAARRRASHVALTFALAGRANAQLQLGSLTSAEADASATLALLEDFPVSQAELIARATLGQARLHAGDTEGARQALDGPRGSQAELAGIDAAVMQGPRAALALAERRYEEARELASSLGERAEHADNHHPVLIPWRVTAALACLQLGDRSDAQALADAQLAAAKGSQVPSALGVALRTSAAVRPGDAIELLTEAVTVLEGSEARHEWAVTLIELGATLRRQRKRREAREPLRAALEEAHVCGARPLVERALVELRAAGGRPRRVMRTGVDALTASERRVAALAAQGLSNAEIAHELFVTPKTVEAHLAHTYRKLDISSRKQLPAALAPGEDGDAALPG